MPARPCLVQLCLLILLSAILGASPCRADDRPNIVFILIDDLGWTDLGFMGSDFYQTPNIDRLASQGMTFTNAYMCAANCAPSRAAIMSGQYAPRTGVYTVGSPDRGKTENRKLLTVPNRMTLPDETRTIADVLSAAGYATAFIGKWHLGSGPTNSPTARGFDINIAGNNAGHPKSYFSPYKNKDLPDGPQGEYLTTRLTDEAIGYVTQARHPFYLQLSYYSVHTPIQPEPDRLNRYKNRKPGTNHDNPRYAAMIDAVDENVGRLVQTINDLNLAQNTLIIFTSDNGGHGQYTSQAPLRGSKGMFYEGGIRVPLIFRWPARIEPASSTDTPVIGVDFFPTLLAAADAPPPESHTLDGVNLLPLLEHKGTIERDALYWHFPAYLEAYRGMSPPWRTTPVSVIRKGRYKLLEFLETGLLELYDLDADPGEVHDLADTMPSVRDRLYQHLSRWRTEIAAPVLTELNPEYRPPSDNDD